MHKPTSGVERAGAGELALVGAALAALTALVLFLTDGAILLTRPFWVDEWFTVLVARRNSLLDLFGDLQRGADGGTGLLHSFLWALHRLGFPISPVALRSLSLLSVLSALLLLYALLRRRVGMNAAVGAVLAVGAHPLVVAHSYEARFYGPWLLCAVLYAWSLARSFEDFTVRAKVGQGVAAVLLCTVHFYGVITLVLMLAATLLGRALSRAQWRESARVVLPSAAGFVAVALIVPLALGQRRAYGVRSWIPDFTIGQLGALLGEFWLAAIPVGTLVVLGLVWWLRRGSPAQGLQAVARHVGTDAGIVSLFGLALVPVALAVVSLAGQPSMISRYATTSALVWAPLVAIALEYLGRTPARMARLLFVWLWLVAYTREARAKLLFAAEVDASRTAIARAPAGVPIYTASIHLMYPVVADSLGGTSRLAFVELSDDMLDRVFTPAEREMRTKSVITERDLARVHSARFGFPRLESAAAIDTLRVFAVLGSRLRLAPAFHDVADFAARVYPTHRFTPVTDELGVLERP